MELQVSRLVAKLSNLGTQAAEIALNHVMCAYHIKSEHMIPKLKFCVQVMYLNLWSRSVLKYCV